MVQKVMIILNAPEDEELSIDGIKYDLEQQGHIVETVEDTLQSSTHAFQPLAFAIQDDASIVLGNSGIEETNKLLDLLSRSASGSEVLADAIMDALQQEVNEGFDDEDLEEDE